MVCLDDPVGDKIPLEDVERMEDWELARGYSRDELLALAVEGKPYAQLPDIEHLATHYVGFANGEGVDRRLEEHRRGQGSAMLAYAVRCGISFDVVRTWQNEDRNFERRLKKAGHHATRCPRCGEKERLRYNAVRRARYAKRKKLASEPWPHKVDDLEDFDDIPF